VPIVATDRPGPADPEIPWLVLLPVLVAALVFRPSPEQFFAGEDLYHIFRALDQPWPALLLQQHAGHLYTSFSVLVTACHALFGMNPSGWFAILLALHLVNVALCVRVIRQVTGSARLAAVGGLLWAIAPTHGDALTWFTMCGQVLATTMILAVLGSALASAERGPGLGRGVLWIAALLIATTSNGAGAAAAVAMPFAVFLLLPATPGRRRAVAVLALVLPLVAVLVAATRFAADRVPGLLPAVTPSLAPNALHVNAVALLFVELVKHGLVGPLLTVAVPSPGAALTWVAVGLWTAAVGTALWRAGDGRRRACLGALLLLAAVYGATALGRGGFYAMLAKATGGEAGALARYHYLATFAGILATCVAFASVLDDWSAPRPLARVMPFVATAALLAAWSTSAWRLDRRADVLHTFAGARCQLETAVRRAAPAGGVARLPNQHERIAGLAGHLAFPGWAAVLVLTEPDQTIDGRRIVLTEPSDSVRELTAHGRRTAGLLVPP
jgi:hypothetical protein